MVSVWKILNMLNRYGKCMENSGRGFYTLLILFHPITIKLTNRFVLCFLKNSLRVLKRFCNIPLYPSSHIQHVRLPLPGFYDCAHA